MPYIVASVLRANEVLSRLDGFEPEAVLDAVGDAPTVLEAMERLGLPAVLEDRHAEVLRDLLSFLPASLDAAMLAAVRSALGRGVRVQLTWQPGYDFELRCWEVSDGSEGVVNLHLVSPEPDESDEPG